MAHLDRVSSHFTGALQLVHSRPANAADLESDVSASFHRAGDIDALYGALTILEALGATAVTAHVKDMIRKRSGRLVTRGPRASTPG